MPKRILWIDNDKVFLAPHIYRLNMGGYMVDQALTLMEGVNALQNKNYDLLILDVMMPIRVEDLDQYSEKGTECGNKAGLVFYKKHKKLLEKKGIVVLVYTIREDINTRDEFLSAGLSAENYMTKSEGADTATFLAKINILLN